MENVCAICLEVFVETGIHICDACRNTIKTKKPIKKKLKEETVKYLLESVGIIYESWDKKVPDGCSNRRPDFVIPTQWGVIVLEVDEFQHNRKNYNCSCELIRMRQIYFDIGTEKVLYVRYNPDKYIPSYGKVFLEGRRHEYLLKILSQYQQNIPDEALTIIYLFYDGFTQLDLEIDSFDPYYDIVVLQYCRECGVYGCDH